MNCCPRDELMCYVAPSNGIFFCTVPHCNVTKYTFQKINILLLPEIANDVTAKLPIIPERHLSRDHPCGMHLHTSKVDSSKTKSS